jgi:hypothetical protein
MKYRSVYIVFVLSLGLLGCNKKSSEQPQQLKEPADLSRVHGGSMPNAVAGVKWSIPSGWTTLPPRQMRVATYQIAGAGGDTDPAECGVFYFGADQGGSVDANIERWVGQFEEGGKTTRSSEEVNGLKIALVRIEGAYLSPGGPMMQSQGKKEGYRLLGAIVSGPQGPVFFKLTGPASAVQAAEKDFTGMIYSLGTM